MWVRKSARSRWRVIGKKEESAKAGRIVREKDGELAVGW
jgi:hypothetical protein